jgi:DNA-binding transcriptional regulator YiaG
MQAEGRLQDIVADGIVNAVGEFRELRRRTELSQEEFAALLGLSPESCRAWDSGRRAVPSITLSLARDRVDEHVRDHELLTLQQLARDIGVNVHTLRSAGPLIMSHETGARLRTVEEELVDARSWATTLEDLQASFTRDLEAATRDHTTGAILRASLREVQEGAHPKDLEPGDIAQLTENQAKAWGDRFKEVMEDRVSVG